MTDSSEQADERPRPPRSGRRSGAGPTAQRPEETAARTLEDQTSVTQPAICCHVVEGVGGRMMSRYLAQAVPKAQVVFDLSVLPETDEAMKLLEACLRNGAMPQVVVVDGPLTRRILAPLMNRLGHVGVRYVLPAALRWQAGDWDVLRGLVALQREHTERLTLLAMGGELCGAVAALGGRALPITLTPVPARRRPRMGRVALLLGRGAGAVASYGHVAAAAALTIAAAEQRVGAILHPEEASHLVALLEAFGLASRLIPYRTTEEALARLGGTPVVYLAPFSDGLVDQDALVVLDQGGLVLAGPGAVPLPEGIGDLMEVPQWEQADAVAAKLVVLVCDYHATWAMLHNRASEASAALLPRPAAA
ncbi:hypothetical protein ACFQU1_02295 [Chelatococcus sp. GCM10030263]|uniref:hypothetical protein n=1 Tax=Chelatococcus sp. GCM10030263 TaxID=3273387 RepID=UPI00360D925F